MKNQELDPDALKRDKAIEMYSLLIYISSKLNTEITQDTKNLLLERIEEVITTIKGDI